MRLKIIVLILISIIFIFTDPNIVFAYGIETHAALTQEIIQFYNQYFSQNKISEALKDFLIDGARREDDSPRWMNHFYDPVYDRGLNDPIWGKGYASKIWAQDAGKQNEVIYKVGGTIASILNTFQQRKLRDISAESNYTWQKAIEYYVQGEPEKAMFALGHILHLIEDAAVPAHTRNDGHPEVLGDEDPYEVWTHRFTRENIHQSVEKYIKDKQPIVFDNLDAYFDSIASYSNNNFYSGDTIGIQSGYNNPQPDYDTKLGKYFYPTKVDREFGDYYLFRKSIPDVLLSNIFDATLESDIVLEGYWSRLSTKAIQHGAGVINLFFQEVEKAKAEGKYQEKQKSFLGQVVDSVTDFVSNIFSGGKPEAVISINEQKGDFESQLIDVKGESKIVSAPVAVKKCQFATNQKPSHKDLIINEVAWMGKKGEANAEWIELKNISGRNLDIGGYQIIDQNEQIHIIVPANSLIPIGNFYLLERDKEETVPGMRADFIYKGPLANTNEGLRVFDANCNLIDEVFANPNWPAGDNETKQTMERDKNLNWHTSVNPGGTPKQENSEPRKEEKEEMVKNEEISSITATSSTSLTNSTSSAILTTSTSSVSETNSLKSISSTSSLNQVSSTRLATSTATVNFCSFATTKSPSHQKVIINEVAWMGTINDANDEWIELKNVLTTDIDISGYQLLDKAEQIKIIFEKGTKIPANGFYLLERTDDTTIPNIKADKIYTGALANSNEGLRLFDPQCNLVDEILAESNWPAGDNLTKQTLERKSDLFWQTSAAPGGTPRAENSSGAVSYIGGGGGGRGSSNINQSQTSNSTPTSTTTSTPGNIAGSIVLSEIYPDKTGNNYDFIELYNPTDTAVDLSTYSLKILKEGATTTESLAVFSGESITQIPAKGFFLVGFDKYNTSGWKPADVFRSSKFLPSRQTAKIILQNGENVVDEYEYDAANLNDGQSFERKAFSNNFCVSAQGNGEFLGNGCDTDSASDWEIRSSANPQNTQSLPEPRAAPTAVTNFNLSYHFSAPTLKMSWDPSVDYAGATSTISYQIEEINSSSSAPFIINTTSTAIDKRIYEIGRTYEVSIKAIDADGLTSSSTIARVEVPSFLKAVYFYRHPNPSRSYYLVDLYYDNYPFIPSLYEPELFSRMIVAYLNYEDMPPSTLLYENYGYFPIRQNVPHATSLRYLRCGDLNINNRFNNFSSVVVLPLSGLGSCYAGWNSDFLNPMQLEDNGHLQLALASSTNEVTFSSSTDFLTFAFYAPYPWSWSGAGGRTYELVAVDKRRYYFQDKPSHLRPPDMQGGIVLDFDPLSRTLGINWQRATDVDTFDDFITYEVNVSPSAGGIDETRWISNGSRLATTINVMPGDDFVIGVRAVDEMGNASEPLLTTWRFPENFALSDWGGKIDHEFYIRCGNGNCLTDGEPKSETIVHDLGAPMTINQIKVDVQSIGYQNCNLNRRFRAVILDLTDAEVARTEVNPDDLCENGTYLNQNLAIIGGATALPQQIKVRFENAGWMARMVEYKIWNVRMYRVRD